MSSLEWLAVGAGPILFLFSWFLFSSKRKWCHRKNVSERLDQLSHRLSEHLSEQRIEQNHESSCVTQQVLEALQESEEQHGLFEVSGLSSDLSSIHPIKESVAELSSRILKLEKQNTSQDDSQTLNLASLAVVCVRSHINDVIRVDQIANELNVSTSKLYNCLKECLGCSAHELITIIKMQEAKRLLKSGDLLVKEVATQLGFWSPYHFSSRFKTFFGLSPNQFKDYYHYREDKQELKRASENPIAGKSHQPEGSKRQAPQDTQNLPLGTEIDRFLIVNRIGHGGMGVVYKAYDPKLNRGIALKLIRTDQAKATNLQNRLLREAQALARLSHPNVLHVYDVGTFGDQVFMTMALVEGQTLKEWLKSKKRTINEVLKVMLAAGRGLSAAHKAGLVHRDFKPQNVIVGDDGQVRVLDFGLARAVSVDGVDDDSDDSFQETERIQELKQTTSEESSSLLLTPLTHAGHVLGTPLYMAPEQHLGQRIDGRSDQFSYCVVLYEALYSRRPFAAKTIKSLKNEIVQGNLRVPPADTNVPTWLWKIVSKGLSAKPEDRYPSLDVLLKEIEKDPQQVVRLTRTTRERKLFLLLSFLFMIVIPVGVWHALRWETVQRCKSAKNEFEGVWDEDIKKRVQQSFLNTGKSYAPGTWTRVDAAFDKYLKSWMQMRSEVCEARLLYATQSEELFDLRMSCLNQRKQELKALASVFMKADATIVEKAVQASLSLNRILICADEKTLRAPYLPPKTKQERDLVGNIGKRLVVVKALQKTGKYQEALALLKSLKEETKVVDYLPVKAQLLYELAYLLVKVGKYRKAETKLYAAARAAGDCGDALLAAKAMTTLVELVGYRLAKPALGLSIAKDTEVMFRVAQASSTHLSRLYNAMGVVLSVQLDYDKGLALFEKALKINEKTLYSEHPQVAYNLNNIGVVLWRKKKYEQAFRYYQRALAIDEKALGSIHPSVARDLNNLGFVLWKQGEYARATQHFRNALEIWSNALGNEHQLLAWPLAGLGEVHQAQGNYSEAIKKFSRVKAICEKGQCEAEPYGHGLFGFARSLVALGRDKQQAIVLARKAREVFGKPPSAFCEEFKEVDDWLQKQGVK